MIKLYIVVITEVGMASIIEACDNTIKEPFAGIKIFLWAIPVCMFFAGGANMLCQSIGLLGLFLFIGLCVTTSNNIITKQSVLVPGINFVKISLNALLALIAMLPYGLIAWFAYWAASFIQIPYPILNDTLHIILDLLIATIPLSALAILVRRMNPLEVLNIKKYLYGFGEIFLSMSYFLVRLALFSAVVVGFLVYIFSLFIGFENSLWTYLLSALGVFYAIIGANFFAQVSDEIYIFPEKEEDKAREQAEIQKILTRHK